MRVIGGYLKGRRLDTFKGRNIRPTGDRVREAIFSILARRVQNAGVLDLFAGTGALGIEAVSRGATRSVFVDNHPGSIAVIRGNIHRCGIENSCRIIKWDVVRNLNCLRSLDFSFNLVFMDPPYRPGYIDWTLSNLTAVKCLAPKARIVIEHSANMTPDYNAATLTVTDSRRYGKTMIDILSV